jgi:hypothetical protein
VGVLGVLAEDAVDLGGGGVGERAGVDDDGHELASGLDGGEGAAVAVPDPDALVVAGRDERDEDTVFADGATSCRNGSSVRTWRTLWSVSRVAGSSHANSAVDSP